jgi:hypothetical protein
MSKRMLLLLQREEYNYECKNASDYKSDTSNYLTRRGGGMRCAEHTTRTTSYTDATLRLGDLY